MASQHLFVLLDVHPYWWGRLTSARNISLTLDNFIQEVIVFCNAFMALSSHNRLTVFGFHTKSSRLFPENEWKEIDWKVYQAHNFVQQFTTNVTKFFAEFDESQSDLSLGQKSGFVSSLINALCVANKLNKTDSHYSTRILVLKLAPSLPCEYLPLMNCLFACQKEKFVLDIMNLCFDSTALQQAANLANGIYFKVPESSKIVHYLLFHFLQPAEYRLNNLQKPPSTLLDYKASCFCHKKLVDVGWVCSVCLSVFCAFTPVCITCSSIFKIPAGFTRKKKAHSALTNGKS